MTVGACRNDGRELRPPKPGQDSSISTTSAPVDDGGISTEPTDAVIDTIPGELLEVTAPWRDGAAIDAWHTCDGLNRSPALSWTPAPEGTVEVAITVTDLDAPGFLHWAVAGLSAASVAVGEDTVPLGAYEGTNGLGDVGYTGPCPPAGEEHLYLITVHYLGSSTGLADGVDGDELVGAIEAAELASAGVTGRFSRP